MTAEQQERLIDLRANGYYIQTILRSDDGNVRIAARRYSAVSDSEQTGEGVEWRLSELLAADGTVLEHSEVDV